MIAKSKQPANQQPLSSGQNQIGPAGEPVEDRLTWLARLARNKESALEAMPRAVQGRGRTVR